MFDQSRKISSDQTREASLEGTDAHHSDNNWPARGRTNSASKFSSAKGSLNKLGQKIRENSNSLVRSFKKIVEINQTKKDKIYDFRAEYEDDIDRKLRSLEK